MKIDLITLISMLLHLLTFYYIHLYYSKIKDLFKKISKIEKKIEKEEKKIYDDLNSKEIENRKDKDKDDDKDDDNDDDDDDDNNDDDDENDNNSTEKKEIIEGFNNINYNDFIENKMKVASSSVYDTDFSNIYNNYVKDNLLDIQKSKYNNNNNTSLYIKSKCRGWKKNKV